MEYYSGIVTSLNLRIGEVGKNLPYLWKPSEASEGFEDFKGVNVDIGFETEQGERFWFRTPARTVHCDRGTEGDGDWISAGDWDRPPESLIQEGDRIEIKARRLPKKDNAKFGECLNYVRLIRKTGSGVEDAQPDQVLTLMARITELERQVAAHEARIAKLEQAVAKLKKGALLTTPFG